LLQFAKRLLYDETYTLGRQIKLMCVASISFWYIHSFSSSVAVITILEGLTMTFHIDTGYAGEGPFICSRLSWRTSVVPPDLCCPCVTRNDTSRGPSSSLCQSPATQPTLVTMETVRYRYGLYISRCYCIRVSLYVINTTFNYYMFILTYY